MDLQLQDGNFYPISLFRINKYLEDDAKNIICSLFRMVAFIRQQKLVNKKVEGIFHISEFGFAAQDFLSSIYKSDWDKLIVNKDNRLFRQCIVSQFNTNVTKNTSNNKLFKLDTGKQTNISKVSSLIPLRPNKSIQAKYKFYKNFSTSSLTFKPNGCLYTQVSNENIKDMVKIKENFPKLSAQKVKEIYKMLNNIRKNKPKINMITKEPFRKQVIIADKVMDKLNTYIANINRLLKEVKSGVLADFMCLDNKDIIITTNKIASQYYGKIY